MALTKPHLLSIAVGVVGGLSAVASAFGIASDTAKCLAQSWTAEAPLLTAVAGVLAATAPLFAIFVKSAKEQKP